MRKLFKFVTKKRNALKDFKGIDFLFKNNRNDYLSSLNNNNYLNSKNNMAEIYGDKNNSRYSIDSTFDKIIEYNNQKNNVIQQKTSYSPNIKAKNITLYDSKEINAIGNNLDNTIKGNKANNLLQGKEGNDTYIIGKNDGNDTIIDTEGSNTLKFAEGITKNDLVFEKNGDNLTIEIKDSNTKILYKDWFTSDNKIGYASDGTNNPIKTESILKLNDGTSINVNDIEEIIDVNEKVNPLNADQKARNGSDLYSTAGITDSLVGGTGDDHLYYTQDSTWTKGYVARNVGDINNGGTNETVNIEGYGRSYDIFDGGEGYDKLMLTDGNDVIALDDLTSPAQGTRFQARIKNIEEIHAGAGNDIIDLTSKRWDIEDIKVYGGEGNDIIWTSGGNDEIYGEAGNDKIYGGIGNNILDGGEGADEMEGGADNDTYIVDNKNDVIIENDTTDIDIIKTKVNYTLSKNVENGEALYDNHDLITVNDEELIVYGDPTDWANNLDYRQGNNTQNISGTCGVVASLNTLIQYGIEGEDESSLLQFALDNGYADENGTTTVYTVEDILEAKGIDAYINYNITADEAANAIKDGKNIVVGVDSGVLWDSKDPEGYDDHAVNLTGAAYDKQGNLKGFYICDSGTLGDAARFISVETFTQAVVDVGGDAVITTGIKEQNDDIQITGNELDNVITGNDSDNILCGGLGHDTLIGGKGNDTYVYDGNGDVFIENANEGIDTIQTAFNYRLNNENIENIKILDSIPSYLKTDNNNVDAPMEITVTGNNSDNTIIGSNNNDIVYAENGDDHIAFATTNNGLKILGVDFVSTEDYTYTNGNNTVYGGEGKDTINGGMGDDLIYGGAGSDRIYEQGGAGGNDSIYGGEGNDNIYAGFGDDYIEGGTGNDGYYFTKNNGNNIIKDDAGWDIMRIKSYDDEYLNGEFNINKNDIAFYMDGDDVYVSTDANSSIKIINQGISENAINSIALYNKDTAIHYITEADINKLIQEMTAYITDNGLDISSVQEVRSNSDLMTIINNGWTK